MAQFHPKLPDWHDRLAECANARVGRVPEWGQNDCMLWAADAILAQTGFDYGEPYRGRYTTAKGALRIIRKVSGLSTPIELMDHLWGPRLHISQAQLGDIVVCPGRPDMPFDMGPSAGVCYGRRSLFVGTDEHEDGLVRLDTLTLEHCYRPWASSSAQ